MIVNVAGRGHSHTAVTQYLVNPKREDREQTPRLGNSETFNLYTDDIEKAAGWMAWMDESRHVIQQQKGGTGAGRHASAGNAYHLSLSWHPDEKPSWEHMRDTGVSAMEARGLAHHQFYIVQHTDEDHKHIHIVASLVDPETGKIATCWKDREALDRWAHDYEKEHGIQCKARDDKYQKWEQDKDAFPDRSQKLDHRAVVIAAYRASSSQEEFQDALEAQELTLAQGKRRSMVVVDQNGDVTSLNRLLPEKQDHRETVTRAYHSADNGSAFRAALQAESLDLQQGRRGGFVVVDQDHHITKLSAAVELEDGTKGRAKTNAIGQRLADLEPEQLPLPKEWIKDVDRDALPKADDVARERIEELERERDGRDDGDGEDERQASLDAGFNDAAKRHHEETSDDCPTIDKEAAAIAQQHALLDGADAHGEAVAEQHAHDAADAKRQRVEDDARQRQDELRARQERWARLQAEVDRNTAESRERWQIDELTTQRDQAREDALALSGFWSRIFRRSQLAEARDHAQDMEKRLEERTGRFRTDVEHYNSQRPEWIQQRELQRHGLEPKTPEPSNDLNPQAAPELDRSTMTAEEFKQATRDAYQQSMGTQEPQQEQDRGREFGRE